ncbi:MAG: WD40 repeat domain-containing protein [Bacteroidota bacterium]
MKKILLLSLFCIGFYENHKAQCEKPILLTSATTSFDIFTIPSISFNRTSNILCYSEKPGTVNFYAIDKNLTTSLDLGKESTIVICLFHPTKDILLIGCKDGSVTIYDYLQNKTVKTFAAHPKSITAAVYSVNGDTLYTAGKEDNINVWTENGELIKTFTSASSAKSIHIRGNKIIYNNEKMSNCVRIIDYKTGVEQKVPVSTAMKMAVSLNGKKAYVNVLGNDVEIWNLENGTLDRKLFGHSGHGQDVAISNDEKILVTSSDDNSVIIWDNIKQTICSKIDLKKDVYTVCISPDSKYIAALNNEQKMYLYQINSKSSYTSRTNAAVAVGNVSSTPTTSTPTPKPKVSEVNLKFLPRQYNEPYSVEWSKDGKYFAVASFKNYKNSGMNMIDGTTTVYSGSGDTVVYARKYEAAMCATFNPINKEMVSCTYSSGLLKFNIGDTSATDFNNVCYEELAFRACYSPDGKDIIVGTVKGHIFISNNETGKLKYKLSTDSGKIIISMHQVNDGKTLISHSAGKIQYWNLLTGTLIKTLSAGDGDENEIACVNLSSDGKTLIAFAPKQILIYDAETGELRKKSSTGNGYCCAVSKDGSLMAFGFSEGFYTFDREGKVIRGMGAGSVKAMAFSPDGKELIVALKEGEILKYLSSEISVKSED